MFGSTVANLFRSGDKRLAAGEVREGATYRHSGPGALTETAKVVHVGPDAMGITHVHYRVMVENACERRAHFEDSRTLNIETFTTHFSEAVEA